MLVALISAIDGLSLLYQRLQTKLHYGFVDILGPWLQYTANLCFSTANTPPITPVESCYLFATGLSYFNFPSSYCRIVVFYRIDVFPSSFHRPFSLRFIFGLSFFLSSYFWIAVFTRLSFFPTSYCLIVVLFTGLTLFPSSYCRIVVLFTGLSLFPSSYYRFSLRLITN